MAFTAVETITQTQAPNAYSFVNKTGLASLKTEHHVPLKLSGALKRFEHFELNPTIGTQFEDINLAKVLRSSDCDQIIRDVAITSKYYKMCTYLISLTLLFSPKICCLREDASVFAVINYD